MVWNVPNTLTLLRMALMPVLLVVFYLPFAWSNLASTAVFGLAALTDWFDGYLARKLGQSSPFGAFLDPVSPAEHLGDLVLGEIHGLRRRGLQSRSHGADNGLAQFYLHGPDRQQRR